MPEYIERETVLKVLHHRIPINEYDKSLFYDGGNVCLSLLEEFVEQLPTADVAEVKHGEWIWTESGEEDYEQYWVCSCCSDKSYIEENFCPNCGADMRGEQCQNDT